MPFPPGGVADIVARPVAEAMSRDLGQPVVIENKPGAGGGIGMGQVAKAQPDGYTVLMALSSITVMPEADKVLGRAPMYSSTSCAPIARFTADPTVLAVRADAPWKTVKDFVDDAKKRPGAINYGSSGNYGTMHVPMEMLAQNAGIKMTHVPSPAPAPRSSRCWAARSRPSRPDRRRCCSTSRPARCACSRTGATASSRAARRADAEGARLQTREYAQWSGLFVPAATPEPASRSACAPRRAPRRTIRR